MNPKTDSFFLETDSSKLLIVLNTVLLSVYFLVISFCFTVSNYWLFYVLIFGQSFYFWQGLSFLYTIWDTNSVSLPKPLRQAFEQLPAVDIFITVAGEPVEVVRKTVLATKEIAYENKTIYILNDGFVAHKDNWKEMEQLAIALDIECITRRTPGGAKAGNINNGLKQTTAPFVVIFDADHVPESNFLEQTLPCIADEKVGYIQTPQYYINAHLNLVTQASWEQQQLFFGTICKGKNKQKAVTMCGTNMVIRRKALEEVGGICDFNIAEDFITGMFIHEKGYTSVYVPLVLAQGLAPEDFLSYQKQQLRWARGSLEVFFKYNPLFRTGLTLPQKIQYLASASYYLSGVVVLIHAIIPLVYFFTGAVPFTSSTMVLTAAFLPYMLLTLYNLQVSCGFTYTFKAIAFSMSSFWIHLVALVETLTGKSRGFAVTSKVRIDGNFLSLVTPHLTYIIIVIFGILYAFFREGLTPSLVTNAVWSLLYIIAFIPFILASVPEPKKIFTGAGHKLQSVFNGLRSQNKI